MADNGKKTKGPLHPKRKSVRLRPYDYGQQGFYFFTICAHQRKCLFGNIRNRKMILNNAGRMVWDVWKSLPKLFSAVHFDAMIVMPNHAHGILGFKESSAIKTKMLKTEPEKKPTLFSVLGAFKSITTKKINEMNGLPGQKIWQRSFYDHVIRNRKDLENTRLYILKNPECWNEDPDHPSLHS